MVDDASTTAPRGSVRTASLWPRSTSNESDIRANSGSRAALLAERHLDAADGFAVGPVDRAAARPAEHPDAVAGTEEREVRRDHPLGERGQLGLGPQLRRRLLLVGVADVERAATEQDPGPGVEVDLAELVALQPVAAQVPLLQPAAAQHGVVLAVGDVVLRPGAEEQERLHACTAAPESISVVDVLDAPGRQRLAGVGAGARPGRCGPRRAYG